MRSLGAGRRVDAPGHGATKPDTLNLLQWVYVGRVLVATVVFLAAAFYHAAVPPSVLVALAIATIASLVMSGASVFYTHVSRHRPGLTLIYLQTAFDLALVTTVVHVTGGAESSFLPLYILVIAVGSVLLPLPSTLLITILASSLFIADVVLGYPSQLDLAVWLQVGVFAAVAVSTGWLASRVRVVGQEREVLQKEVKRLRLEAADILENISSGVVTVDGEGNLLYANRAAEGLLSFRAADHLGGQVMPVLQARSAELAAAIRRTQRDRLQNHRADGKVRVAERSLTIGMTTTTVESPEEVPPVTAIFTDISDQKRIQALDLRAGRLEAVAELSASLAHEIKNPLASIRSSVEQLAKSSQASEDDRFLGQLVVRESDRLSRLLNEFLEFARVRVALSRPVELSRLIHSAIEVVQRHPSCSDRAQISFEGDCPVINGDEDLLHRIVVNLVLNAVQAADGDVEVKVEAREARPEDVPGGVSMGSAVVLRVVDDGPGIPSELRERLFDPFVTGRVGGSGLGLAVVQRAVQAHRGFVFVDSRPGSGTTFTVLLPTDGGHEATA
jgi:two-component system sensor histidine kinase PilS (NtrC family)